MTMPRALLKPFGGGGSYDRGTPVVTHVSLRGAPRSSKEVRGESATLQGYFAHEKTPPPGTLP